jgi:hypothetical protein
MLRLAILPDAQSAEAAASVLFYGGVLPSGE